MTLTKYHISKNRTLNIHQINELLSQNNNKIHLVFENGKTDDEYRKKLQAELPNHHVFNVRWKPEIWIYPAINTQDLFELQDEILVAAKAFRHDAMNLIKLVGEIYQLNPLADVDELWKLRKICSRGNVNEEWSYCFHGAECRFENHNSGQIVEVIITNKTEFGALDSYFFLEYMRSKPKFKELAEFFLDDTGSVTKALNLLEDNGKLIRIS